MWTFKDTGTLKDISGMYICFATNQALLYKALAKKNVILACLNCFFHSQYIIIIK